eukprot:4553722-Pyramimonas_sp.AAC.1
MLCATCLAYASSDQTLAQCVSCAVRNLWATGQAAAAAWSSGGSLGTQGTPANYAWTAPGSTPAVLSASSGRTRASS